MNDTVFRRVGSKLRNGSVIALQVAQGQLANIKATEHHPAAIRAIVKEVREGMNLLEGYADEQEVSLAHDKENAEAYASLSDGLSNVAQIFGKTGENIKILLFSDPDFLLEVLTDGQPEALEQAIRGLDSDRKRRIAKWVK